jgi:carbon-monoxide dehydrogenase medium subunit
MKPIAFDYAAPRSLEEALAALAEGGDDAKPIAGGQSLVPALNLRLVRPTLLVDLAGAGLDTVAEEAGALRVGATVTQRALERDGRAHPLLRQALRYLGHVATRNRGTVGGSVAHADGAAEIPLCLAALRGTVIADGPSGRREIDAEDFFVTHYTTTLARGELVVETRWPSPAPGEGAAFEELALRAGDYALAMVAVVLRREGDIARDVRVAVGAVTDRPTLLSDAAATLEGTGVTAADARASGVAAGGAVDPVGSIHASPRYLRSLTATLVERAALRAWEATA